MGPFLAEGGQVLPFTWQEALPVHQLVEDVMTSDDRLLEGALEECGVDFTASLVVEQVHDGLGYQLDQVWPAGRLGVNSLDAARSPELGREARAGPARIVLGPERRGLEGLSQQEAGLGFREWRHLYGPGADQVGSPWGMLQLVDLMAAGEGPGQVAVGLDRLAHERQEILRENSLLELAV